MNTPWRNSARFPTIFGLDSRAALFLVVWGAHMRWWTFYFAISGFVFFGVLSWFGWTPTVIWHWIRSWAIGNRRPARRTNQNYVYYQRMQRINRSQVEEERL